MKYKEYTAQVAFDDNTGAFHGEVINLSDVITFQGSSVEELRQEFANSVEDYLAFCKERGEDPEKPFSGRFVVRVNPELHRRAVTASIQHGTSLNAWVKETLANAVGATTGKQNTPS